MARALRECVDAEKGSGMGTERVPGMVRRGIATVPSLGEGGGKGDEGLVGGAARGQRSAPRGGVRV